MTYIPNGQVKYLYEPDADYQEFMFAPYYSNHRNFDFHPNCLSGGTKRDHFYWGTYLAGLKDDAGTLKFNSCSGVQPWTGGQMRSVPFTDGNTEFVIGETITGVTSGATGVVVSFHKSSGDWTAGTAVGTVYIRNYGVEASTATAFSNGEPITRVSGSATTTGASTVIYLPIDDALTYATNKGAGWTITGVYDLGWVQGLLYAQWLSRDSQTAVGKGVAYQPVGVGYNGLLNGANNIDSNLNSFGTGMGDGTNGQTPIEVNNICDLFAGLWQFVSGVNVMIDGTVRLTKPDGTGSLAGTLAENTYITLPEKTPLVDGYISTVQKLSYDANPNHAYGALTFTPLTAGDVGSGSAAGYCDYWYYPRNDPSGVRYGGYWQDSLAAGIGCRCAPNTPLASDRNIGTRLKYVPQS